MKSEGLMKNLKSEIGIFKKFWTISKKGRLDHKKAPRPRSKSTKPHFYPHHPAICLSNQEYGFLRTLLKIPQTPSLHQIPWQKTLSIKNS